MDISFIREVATLLENSKMKKISIKHKDFEISLEKEDDFSRAPPPPAVHHPHPPLPDAPHHHHKPHAKKEETGAFVTSPMVGTFYGRPSPDDPSFVKVGDEVTEETVVCIIEAMKVMNEVKAGMKGVVAEVCIQNGQPVEFGSRLLRLV